MRFGLAFIAVATILIGTPLPTWAQPTPPPPISSEPNAQAPTANDPFQKGLRFAEQWQKFMTDLETQMKKGVDDLREKKKTFDNAEKFIADMLTEINRGIEEARPNGDLMKMVEQFIADAANTYAEAQAKQLPDLAKEALKQKTNWENLKLRLTRAYNSLRGIAREIENRKDELAIAKKLNALDQAYEIANSLVTRYEEALRQGKEILETLPPGRTPTQ